MSNTWKPVQPGDYGAITVYNGGKTLEMPEETCDLPDDVRLCESVEDNDTPPVWAYAGPATVDVYGGGMLALRLEAPDIPQGPPERGVYTIRLELLESNDD